MSEVQKSSVIQFPFHRRVDLTTPVVEFGSECVGADFGEEKPDRGIWRGPPEFDGDVEAAAVDVEAQIHVEGTGP